MEELFYVNPNACILRLLWKATTLQGSIYSTESNWYKIVCISDPRIYCRETVDPASTRMALGNRTASSQFGCNLNFRGSPTPNICLTGNGVPIATASAVNATAGNLTSASYQWSYPADINSTAFVNGTSVYPCSSYANVPGSSQPIHLKCK